MAKSVLVSEAAHDHNWRATTETRGGAWATKTGFRTDGYKAEF